MTKKLNIKLVKRDSEAELMMKGEMDAQTLVEVEEYFEDVSDRFDHLILNMAELSYISSAGLRLLKHLHFKMHKKGGTLTIKGANGNLMEVFSVTGFTGLLNFATEL